jgi:hypothetical protein
MRTIAGGSQAHLSLTGNTGVSAPADDFLLIESAGTFELDNEATGGTANVGTVSVDPMITEETDSIPTPQLP